MWKWYKEGIKYLHSYDIDSVCLGSFFLGILVGSLEGINIGGGYTPIVLFALGIGFLSAPIYKFFKRDKLAFEPEVIVKTVVKKAPAKKKSPAKKTAKSKK